MTAFLVGIAVFVLALVFVGRVTAEAARQQVELEGPPGRSRGRWRSLFSTPVFPALAMGAAAALIFPLVDWISGDDRPDPPPPPIVDPTPDPDKLNADLEAVELSTAASIHRAQLAEAKVDQQQAAQVADRALELVDEWEQEIQDWDDNVLHLLTDSQGQSVAAHPELVRQYRALVYQPRTNRLQADQLRQRIASLAEPVRLALADDQDAYKPEETTLVRLRDYQHEAQTSRDEYRRVRLQVQTLVTTAHSRGRHSERSLQRAINEQVAAERREANALLEREREQARQEAAATIAQAEAEAIRLAGEGQAQIKRAEAEAQKLLDDQQARRVAEQGAAARQTAEEVLQAELAKKQYELLVQQFDREWPGMKSYLIPFTTPGYTQPTTNGNWDRQPDKTPVSLGAMRTAKMLLRDGSYRDLYAKTSANSLNDRPLGGFPRYGGPTRDYHEVLRRVQEFLIKYGDVMVDKELLMP